MALKSPGVYTTETMIGAPASAITATTVAIIGLAGRGPDGPQLITSTKELIEKFGNPLTEDCTVSAAFKILEKCSRMYFIRVIEESAAKATGTQSDISLTAKEYGTYLNGYKVTIKKGENEVTAEIENEKGIVVEKLKATGTDAKQALVKSELFDVENPETAVTVGDADIIIEIAGGTNGTPTEADYEAAMQPLKNLDAYQVDIITAPGIWSSTDEEFVHKVNNHMTNLCEKRKKDCIAILEIPVSKNTPTLASAFADSEDNGAQRYTKDVGAFFWPGVTAMDDTLGIGINLPASVYAIRQICFTDKFYNFWTSPAGLTRGVLDGMSNLLYVPDQDDRDILCADEHVVNPLTIYRGQGPVLFGNYTCYRVKADPYEALNVRRLVSRALRDISRISGKLLFEFSNTKLWDQWKTLVGTYLDSIQNNGGLYEYKLVMDNSNNTDDDLNNARLNGKIYLRPAKAIKTIELDFVVTAAGVEWK